MTFNLSISAVHYSTLTGHFVFEDNYNSSLLSRIGTIELFNRYVKYSVFHRKGHQEYVSYKLVLGVLRYPMVSLGPQRRAQITFR